MSQQPIAISTTQAGITTITITRPHRRNAVNPETARALYSAFIAFEEDDSQRVAIITGADGAFCAGADLVEFAAQQKQRSTSSFSKVDTWDSEDNFQQPPEGQRSIAPMGPSRLQVKKPLIAAVAGHAVAGGLELSLLADMRVVEEDAIFGVYCRRWGVPLIDGGTVRLQAIVGLGRAMDMILTGRAVDAQEALAMGLASRVVPKGKALEEATKIAEQLLRFPNRCMNADRASCYYAAYNATSFDDAMRNEFDQGIKVVQAESVSGAAKFAGGMGRHGGFEKL
jgi:enoyl-CoA hydratase/carnithine racemase